MESIRQIIQCKRAIAFTVMAMLFTTMSPLWAQTSDRLSLSNTNRGYDKAASQKVLSEHFAGIWRVTHTDKGGQSWSGRAQVASDGSTINLTLTGPKGDLFYELIEAEAVRYEEDKGVFTVMLTARFKKSATSGNREDGQSTIRTLPFTLPLDHDLMSFEKAGIELDLPITWSEGNLDRIRVRIHRREDNDKYEGLWSEERAGDLKGGGVATWIRGGLSVEGVLVVENQLDPTNGANYPFTPDGTPIDHVLTHRTLVIYGKNLPEFADGADIQSQSEHISFVPVFTDGDSRQRLIAKTFKNAGVKKPDNFDAFLVKAELSKGIVPGTKSLSVDGEYGSWPLLFANQFAKFHFSRSGGEPTLSFYPGDTGYVELFFETEMPFKEIPIRILRGDKNPIEEGVLPAKRLDDGDPLVILYRTDPFHLYHRENATQSPPEDENILRVPAGEGMVLKAALLDRAEVLTVPPVLRAQIYNDPSQLGGLWKEALQRVAKCYAETIDDFETYQLQEATRISKVILTELKSRDIRLLKGDHAAAILIRDEFVSMSGPVMGNFLAQSTNRDRARAAIASTRKNPAIAQTTFWQDSEAVYVVEGMLWSSNTEMPLIDALESNAIAERFDITPGQAQAWAAEQTMAASKKYAEKMQISMSWALDAGDCDVGALLLVAGHRSLPVVARLMPRLVKLETAQGPPKRQYWVTDTVAQGFVKSLYVAGAAVRALEQYSEIDTNVGVAVAAIATAGLSIGLEAAGYAAAAMWANLAASAADLAYGLVGVQNYLEGETFYEYAQGAAPAMGDDILADAMADRQSPLMAAIGVLLPAAGGASNLKAMRNFKNVQKGKALLKTKPGALGDLTGLSDAERTALAGYYTDLMGKVKRSGVDKLDEADRAAYKAFTDYFKPKTSSPAPIVSQTTPDPGLVKTADGSTPTANPNFSGTFNEPGVVKGADLPDTIRDPVPGPIGELVPNAKLPPSGIDPEATVTMHDPNLEETLPPPGIDPEATVTMPGVDPHATLPPPGFDPEATVTMPGVDPHATLPPPGFDPDATLPPGANAGDPLPEFGISPDGKRPLSQRDIDAINNAVPPTSPSVEPPVVQNDTLAVQLAKLDDEAKLAERAGNTPGASDNVENLKLARNLLSNGTPEELKVAQRLEKNMRTLGVPDIEAVRHTALFYKRTVDAKSGFQPKMIQAKTVAEGIFDYGRRPVSLAEFTQVTGVSPTAARAVIREAAKEKGAIYHGSDIVPILLTR